MPVFAKPRRDPARDGVVGGIWRNQLGVGRFEPGEAVFEFVEGAFGNFFEAEQVHARSQPVHFAHEGLVFVGGEERHGERRV